MLDMVPTIQLFKFKDFLKISQIMFDINCNNAIEQCVVYYAKYDRNNYIGSVYYKTHIITSRIRHDVSVSITWNHDSIIYTN